MRTSSAAAAAIAVSLALCSCSDAGSAKGDTSPSRPLDAEVDALDPNCHWDCFGGYGCDMAAGIAFEYFHAPVPCASWTGECPRVFYMCAEGCNPDPITWPMGMSGRPWLACREYAPRRPGDRCFDGGACDPAAVPDGGAVPLMCDPVTATCVAAP